ncbi:hypothetical protein AB9P05_21345 [Roseivirga sp. BDSF3-8]|uniref:hypothetical protein n=1 Tax=Roseivirga sp. BDSF3-8 TaxID=3241598 RepID=UPI003531E89C
MKKGHLLLLLLTLAVPVLGQNLDNLGDKAPVQLSGSIRATSIGYTALRLDNRRDPFAWYTSGTLNVSLYGWAIPFTFSYSDQDKSFRQPFNRFAFSPTYKWVKAHVGYSSMQFSPYTLSGHVFFGGGVELTPGDWRISAMYGRLQDAVAPDTTMMETVVPAYERWGYGLKGGYDKGDYALYMNLFHAEDKTSSLSYTPEDSGLLPQENLAMSISGRSTLFGRFSLEAKYAMSAFTRDKLEQDREGEEVSGTTNLTSQLAFLHNPNSSTQYFSAYKASLAWNGPLALQLNYERVDPGYRTLGAYYFNNDLENVTISGSVPLLQNKLQVAVNTGSQRNNLDDTETSQTRRLIGSVNVNYVPLEAWSFNGSYSNFTTYTNVTPQFDPFYQENLDTLNFYQVSQTGTATVAHNFGAEALKQSLMFTGTYQHAAEESNEPDAPALEPTVLQSGTMSYRLSFESGMGVNAGVNGYRSLAANMETLTLGPAAGANKSWLENRLQANLNASYNWQQLNGDPTGDILSLRLTGSYTPGKKESSQPPSKTPDTDKKHSLLSGKSQHNFSLNVVYLQKLNTGMEATSIDMPGFTEYTATLNYTYSF